MTEPTTAPCPELKCGLPEHDSNDWHAALRADGTFERWRCCGYRSEYEKLRAELAELRTQQFELLIQSIDKGDPRLMAALHRAARIAGESFARW